MYEGIYLVFIRSLCIFVDKLTVCYTFIHFFNIKYEYNITLRIVLLFRPDGLFDMLLCLHQYWSLYLVGYDAKSAFYYITYAHI